MYILYKQYKKNTTINGTNVTNPSYKPSSYPPNPKPKTKPPTNKNTYSNHPQAISP